MENADLDYNSSENEESNKGYSKVLLWISRVVIIVITVIIGFTLMNLVNSLISFVKQVNYKPTESVLNSPREPYTVYEVMEIIEINIIGKKDEGNLKVILPKVVLAYNKNNIALSQVLSTKGSRIGRIVRESISSKSISDLLNTQLWESVVKESLVIDINNYLMGVEVPVEGDKSGNVVKKGNEIRLLSVVKKNKANNVSQDYFKVLNLEDDTQGWVPVSCINLDDTPLVVSKDFDMLNGKKTGGVGDLESGIIDIYFPRGIRVMPIKTH